MKKTKRKMHEPSELHWSVIAYAAKLLGVMDNSRSKGRSKGESLRVSGILKKQVAAGRVEKTKRGVYRLIEA